MNPYADLGLKPPVSINEVKRAYKVLAKKHHPDCGGNAADFRRVNEAYNSIMAGRANERKETPRSEYIPPSVDRLSVKFRGYNAPRNPLMIFTDKEDGGMACVDTLDPSLSFQIISGDAGWYGIAANTANKELNIIDIIDAQDKGRGMEWAHSILFNLNMLRLMSVLDGLDCIIDLEDLCHNSCPYEHLRNQASCDPGINES